MLFKTCIKAYKAETSILKKDKTKYAHRWILKKYIDKQILKSQDVTTMTR